MLLFPLTWLLLPHRHDDFGSELDGARRCDLARNWCRSGRLRGLCAVCVRGGVGKCVLSPVQLPHAQVAAAYDPNSPHRARLFLVLLAIPEIQERGTYDSYARSPLPSLSLPPFLFLTSHSFLHALMGDNVIVHVCACVRACVCRCIASFSFVHYVNRLCTLTQYAIATKHTSSGVSSTSF